MAEFERRAPRGIEPRQKPPQKQKIERDRLSAVQFTAAPARYDTMPYRRCGASGLKLPAISLGAWETFGGYRGPEVARACIFRAFNLGITHFDLANNYGQPPGRAETVVGRIVREMPRDELIISTKAGFFMWPGVYGQGCSRKSLLASIDQSLERLGLDYVDLFYAHRADPEVPLEETLGALDQIVRSGKALYVGVSNYSGKLLQEAAGLARHFHLAPIIAVQSSYSLLRRTVETDLFPAARGSGVGVIAFSPLAQGLLSAKYLEKIPDDSRGAKLWSEEQRH
ncbi:MAG: L-glyceraldehyde 3-phosphate reductase, partial [Verrucomicrobiota bacterium]